MSDMAGEAARVAVEPSGSERDTMELDGMSDIEHVAIGSRAGRLQRS
jgi:hypothetical protein